MPESLRDFVDAHLADEASVRTPTIDHRPLRCGAGWHLSEDGSRLVAAAQGRQVNGSPSRNRSHDRQQGG